ncbi:MAG: hypothetical protein ACUVQN_02330 [Caldisericia bacterium]
MAIAGFIISTIFLRRFLNEVSYLALNLALGSNYSIPLSFINLFKNILQPIWIVISNIIYFIIAVFGVSLYVIGSIYNNVLKITENFKKVEVVKE